MPAGYNLPVCVRCTINGINYDTTGITLVQDPDPCFNTISPVAAGSLPSTTHPYVLNGSGDTLTFEDFFDVTDATCFASATCVVEETCGSATSLAEISSTTATQFTKINNVSSGYNIPVCIRCTMNGVNYDQTSVSLVQDPDPCPNALTPITDFSK